MGLVFFLRLLRAPSRLPSFGTVFSSRTTILGTLQPGSSLVRSGLGGGTSAPPLLCTRGLSGRASTLRRATSTGVLRPEASSWRRGVTLCTSGLGGRFSLRGASSCCTSGDDDR
uniref:Secreted protein n=1 Tax=Knipowitschia caucasica TaxID=637954 RepID=A0AAV2JYA7_KNICA